MFAQEPIIKDSRLSSSLLARPAIVVEESFKSSATRVNTDKVTYGVNCSCVRYAQGYGALKGIGWARNHPMNTQTPQVGAIVVTTENSAGTNSGHLAVVTKVTDDGIYVKEANYVPCTITYDRFIAFSSGLIRGYWI